MREIDVSENTNFVFVEGVLMDKGITHIAFNAISKSGEHSIPNTVTVICVWAFCGCINLTSVRIPTQS